VSESREFKAIPRTYYFDKEMVDYYADDTEPKLYPDKYVSMVRKSALDEAIAEVSELKNIIKAFEMANATANELLERAVNAMVSGCRCDKRFHLDIMCSDGNRTYYERESCELCSMAKEIEQHRDGKWL
jgi:hypothetical protein